MKMLEEAIIYATIMHQGEVRKFYGTPYILHPLEVSQILSTITDDEEVITSGILHDIVEDTDGTMREIEKRFGKRVASLVLSESENKYPEDDPTASWKRRKEESLLVLKNSEDPGVKMLWLADKLANIRSLAGIYSEKGEEMWQTLHQKDPAMHKWYYQTVAETVELSLNKTGAFKEFIKHINFIWPGTFDTDKTKYKKYREVSVDGCKMLGHGAKGEVYRYDDELVIKVYNEKNTYHDVEQEIALARRAFILGVPTAISFGIVSVGNRYGSMYELVDSETVSNCISRAPGQVGDYAKIMADMAHVIHSIEVSKDDVFPDMRYRLKKYVSRGVELEDEELGKKCMALIDTLPDRDTLLHGDFHTCNVFMQNGEPLLIDMDRIQRGHPISELSDLHYYYITLGLDDPTNVEKFMGFSYDTAKKFFDLFLKAYLGKENEDKFTEVKEQCELICCMRMMSKFHKKIEHTDKEKEALKRYESRLEELVEKYGELGF